MKNSLKQLLSLLLALAVVFVASSCGDDDGNDPVDTTAAPAVTTPSASTTTAGVAVNITFSVTTAGGYASTAISNTVGGTATVSSEPAAGATSGDVVVAFTAGDMAGAGAVTITVTDSEGETDDATAVITIEAVQTTFRKSGVLGDETWTTGSIIILEDRVTVPDGVTLTIEPGVVVKGEVGAGANASALLIARGGTLNANGTAASPIIFTTIADEIMPGEIASPNLAPDVQGLWGGLIILGRAPISADADAVQIEGIPPSDTNGLYGGTANDDNSGTIRYISIRHGGTNIGEGNEINGLTLGGVGNGTTIEFVEIIGNQDDGIEPFGGSVDVTNLLVWNAGDDSFDCDQAYTGTIDNFIGILGGNSDHGLELDGPEGSADGAYTLQNGSIKGKGAGSSSGGEYADLRSDAKCTLNNIYFFGFSENSDFELDNNGVANNYLQGEITLTNLQFNVSHLSEGNLIIADIVVEKADTDEGETLLDIFTQMPLPTSVEVVTAPTVGADKAPFASWTWADAAGELADF